MGGRLMTNEQYDQIVSDRLVFGKPAKQIAEEIGRKETVVFKGSQYLEWIVEKLLANPNDIEKLARQDEAHRRRRASWGLK